MKAKQPIGNKPSPGSRPEISLVVQQDPHSLREKTLARLREGMLVGYFQPGEQLVERDLCAKLDVSRTSLREALRHLETEGVVESRRGEGVFVKVLTSEDIRDIYELRMTLDAEAAWYFSKRASKADRRRLKEASQQLNKVDHEDHDRIVAVSNRLFSVLYEGTGNKLFQDIIRSQHMRISLLRSITSRARGSEAEYLEGVRLLQEVVSEIEGGNSRKAARLARQFAARSFKIAVNVFSKSVSGVVD